MTEILVSGGLAEQLKRDKPTNEAGLRNWLRTVLDIELPEESIIKEHSLPLAYLANAFFEDRVPRDAVVWASRGGGKTFYAAVATLLDMVYKPGIEVRILGGSLDQSARMHEHLRRLLERPAFAGMVAGRMTERRIRLGNGSTAEILAQSQTSVRGTRPQKLRCDEAELFDPAVWTAAQLTTRSKLCDGEWVRGSIEALSTWHRPGGLMAELVESTIGDGAKRRLFRWGTLDVLEECPKERDCDTCPLLEDCNRRAKERIGGHVLIDDAIELKGRVDRVTWESEMLCRRPARSDAVYPEFDRSRHVMAFEADRSDRMLVWVAGMDFGFRAPTVVLYACVAPDGMLRIVDERVQSGVVLDKHIQAITDGRWPKPVWVGIDPAGNQRSGQTGNSDASLLRAAGLAIRARRAGVDDGLRAVRTRLAPASGGTRLIIHPRCVKLIEAMERYHYPPDRPESLEPVKDGHDHAADALRYLVVNLDCAYRGMVKKY